MKNIEQILKQERERAKSKTISEIERAVLFWEQAVARHNQDLGCLWYQHILELYRAIRAERIGK